MERLTKDELPVDDAEFDEEILDNLTIDPFSDIRGLIALFYRNLWAMDDAIEIVKGGGINAKFETNRPKKRV